MGSARTLAILQLDKTTEIYYELIGGEQGKPCLVFLHEGLGCAGMWKDFPAQLCRQTGCPGLVYDRSGYGKSSPLSAPRTIHYLHRYALEELPQVLERLIPATDYVVIGHSDGGSIALIHAAEKPARLLGTMTEAAHVFVEQETLVGVEAAVAAFNQGKLRDLARYHAEKTESIFWAWANTWRTAWFAHWNIAYLLPSIACPVLAIQGTEDQYGTPAQVDAIVTRALHAEKAWIGNCGHTPHQEQPQAVLAHMRSFVQRYGG